MSSDLAIKVENLSKCYQLYDLPRNRLKQFILPHLQRSVGLACKQYFQEFWALKNIDFEIKKGETVGIIGRNGSGKSTLLQIICGTLTPTSGVITTRGRIAALLELGAGFNPEFTGRENLYMNASVLGLAKSEIDARLDEIVNFAEIGEFIDHSVKTYSSGMYARLAFSIAINVEPEILIVDEALAVGDARFVAKCMKRIKDIQKLGASVLFVSHDVGSVRTLCERVIWLDKGNLVEQGPVFPVTGRFTEYMFRDESNEGDDSKSKNKNRLREPLKRELERSSDGSELENNLGNHLTPSELDQTQAKSLVSFDARPVTHWGTCKGIISAAAIYDSNGVKKDVFSWGEKLNIVVDVNVPSVISRESLSIAFSIKDLKGTDLITSTTRDIESHLLPDDERFSVSFWLNNYFVTGKYVLVVAVENRLNPDVQYYEYLEGAQYFASLATQRFFGVFQPPIEQQIKV